MINVDVMIRYVWLSIVTCELEPWHHPLSRNTNQEMNMLGSPLLQIILILNWDQSLTSLELYLKLIRNFQYHGRRGTVCNVVYYDVNKCNAVINAR